MPGLSRQLAIKPQIRCKGRPCRQQRNVGFFSDVCKGFRYSGIMMPSIPPSEGITTLIKVMNDAAGAHWNSVLVNEYPDGDHYISDHSDNENGLCPFGGVGTISCGAIRKMIIKDKLTKARIERRCFLRM